MKIVEEGLMHDMRSYFRLVR